MTVFRFRSMLPAVLLVGLLVACQSAPEPVSESAPSTPSEQPSEQPAQQQAPEPQAPAVEMLDEETARELAEQITEEDMARFAEGVRAVAEREEQLKAEGRDYETRRRAARTPIERVEAEQETLREMQDALAEVGLEFESFLRMAQFVRPNPILMERLREHLTDEEIAYFYGEL